MGQYLQESLQCSLIIILMILFLCFLLSFRFDQEDIQTLTAVIDHITKNLKVHKNTPLCAVASWLLHSNPDRAVWEHCVVFLGKSPYSHGASLHPGV